MITTPPDFVGWVTAIEPGDGDRVLGRIVVESQAGKIVRRLIVTITADTQMHRREAGATRQVGLESIARRDQAELWLTSSVPGSFPAEVTALQVVVEQPY